MTNEIELYSNAHIWRRWAKDIFDAEKYGKMLIWKEKLERVRAGGDIEKVFGRSRSIMEIAERYGYDFCYRPQPAEEDPAWWTYRLKTGRFQGAARPVEKWQYNLL